MLKYILQRFVQLILVLIVVSIVIFIVVRLTPIDPVLVISGGKQLSEETISALRAEYNLDKSQFEQYIIWISGIFKGDLGKSFSYRTDVSHLIAERIGITFQTVLMSSIVIIVMGIPLGILAASKKNSITDQCITITSLILVSAPAFFTGIILMLMFTLLIPVFPTFGTGRSFADNLKYLTLPALSLAAVRLALTIRITRSNMVEQLSSDYVRMATAKGLTRRQVTYNHALKNSFIPILTVVSLQISGMLGGSVTIEKVFSLNGLGSLLAIGINISDYPITQSLTLLMVTVYMVCNLIVDILYAVTDPRIRLSGKEKNVDECTK